MPTIVIDPGHGGAKDGGGSTWRGAVGPGGTAEKDVTLKLARTLKANLGAAARLTRQGDVNLPLARRAAIARDAGADVFVSIHANAGAAGARGTEVWVHERAGARSAELARTIKDCVQRLAGVGCSVQRGRLDVLAPGRLAPDTAACLIELDYLSTVEGERRLSSDVPVKALAGRIADGLRRFVAGGTQSALGGRRPAAPGAARTKVRPPDRKAATV